MRNSRHLADEVARVGVTLVLAMILVELLPPVGCGLSLLREKRLLKLVFMKLLARGQVEVVDYVRDVRHPV